MFRVDFNRPCGNIMGNGFAQVTGSGSLRVTGCPLSDAVGMFRHFLNSQDVTVSKIINGEWVVIMSHKKGSL